MGEAGIVKIPAWRYLDPQRLLLARDCGLMTISRSLARELQ
jgi:hypothetical protein